MIKVGACLVQGCLETGLECHRYLLARRRLHASKRKYKTINKTEVPNKSQKYKNGTVGKVMKLDEFRKKNGLIRSWYEEDMINCILDAREKKNENSCIAAAGMVRAPKLI